MRRAGRNDQLPASLFRFVVSLVPVALFLAWGVQLVFAQEATPQSLSFATVDLRVVPSRTSIERDEQVTLFVSILNKSSLAIEDLQVSTQSQAFSEVSPWNPGEATGATDRLAAFQGTTGSVVIEPNSTASYADHAVLVVAKYRWNVAGTELGSEVVGSVNLRIRREFEDELGGVLGGIGAAALYLLLPIYPAFVAYEIADGLRRGEGFRLPTFKPQESLPAAIAAIGVSIVIRLLYGSDVTDAFLNPYGFIPLLAISALFGLAIPTFRFLRSWHAENPWRRSNITLSGTADQQAYLDYLRLVLSPRNAPLEYQWVKVKHLGQDWGGLLLHRSPDRVALGAQLNASFTEGELTAAQAQESLDLLLKNPSQLIAAVAGGQVLIQKLRSLTGPTGGTPPENLLVVILDEATIVDTDITAEGLHPLIAVIDE